MVIGFYFHVAGPAGARAVLAEADAACASVGFSDVKIANEHGLEHRYYRRSATEPQLDASYGSGPGWFAMSLYPIEDEHFAAYGPELLTRMFAELCIRTNAAIGRTFREGLYGVVERTEVDSSLRFVDWYQYFSKSIADRLGGTAFLQPWPVSQSGGVRQRRV
jgi:hypothetical protein